MTDIAWRRSLGGLAARLRAELVHFDLYATPIPEPEMTHSLESRVLSPTGALTTTWIGAQEYLVRLEASLPAEVVERLMESGVPEEEGRTAFDPILSALREANENLGIPATTLFADTVDTDKDARILVLGEWHFVSRPFNDLYYELRATADYPPSADELMDDPAGLLEDPLSGPYSEGGFLNGNAISRDERSAVSDWRDETLAARGQETGAGAVEGSTRAPHEPLPTEAAHLAYEELWSCTMGLLGPMLLDLGDGMKSALTRRDIPPVFGAGIGRMHPVLSQFPELVRVLPRQIAALLPPALIWCVWPNHTHWTRPSSSLPNAAAMMWGQLMSDRDPTRTIPGLVVSHPHPERAPSAYHYLRALGNGRAGPPAAG